LSAPGLQWDATYGGPGDDQANSVVVLPDGGFALGAVTDTVNDSDAWLIRTDASGVLEWDNTYGGDGDQWAWDMQGTDNGEFVLAGWHMPQGTEYTDGWFARIDSSGNLLWENTMGGKKTDTFAKTAAALGGGYVLSGFTESTGVGEWDAWVVKISEDGDEVWTSTYGGFLKENAIDFLVLADGGLAMAGWTNSQGEGEGDFWFARTNANGELLWEKTFGSTDNETAYALAAHSDGGFALVGTRQVLGDSASTDVWLVRIDESGELLWEKTFGHQGADSARSMLAMPDGGFVVAGSTTPPDTTKTDLWLLRTNMDGSLVWDASYGGQEAEAAMEVVSLGDGSFAATGWTSSFGEGGKDVWLLQTTSECCFPDCGSKVCGDDGCGGSCGVCDDGFVCNEGTCGECIPQCNGKECGENGCGGSCGECGLESFCYLGKCETPIPLADTGQTQCYNDTGAIDCPSLGEPFWGQDASYEGTPLSLKKNGDGTITDLNTGLVWAACQGGQSPPYCFGQAGKVPWQEAVDHCTQNADGLPGIGWRLASRNELLSIMHVSETGCLPSEYFVSVPDAVWTATEYPFSPDDRAYAISFGTCSAGGGWYKEEQLAYFRCVRGEPLLFGKLVPNSDGTVSDLSTSLMWQEKDDGQERTWAEALDYCEELVLAGTDDWRLPNAREMMTLMDYTLPNASIYEGAFPGAGQKTYWTGTTLNCTIDSAYAVNHVAAMGYSSQKKTMPMNVRCVHGF